MRRHWHAILYSHTSRGKYASRSRALVRAPVAIVEHGTGGEGQQPLLGKAEPLQGAEIFHRPHAQHARQRRLERVHLEPVLEHTDRTLAACRRVRSAAPADGLAQITLGRHSRERRDQPVCPLIKLIAGQEDVKPRAPVVVLRRLVVEAKQLRPISNQCRGVGQLRRNLVQPRTNDVGVEAAR